MQTIDEVKEHCRFVGEGIEKMVAETKTNAKTKERKKENGKSK